MEIEKLVLSIEQAKHLQDLGLDMSDAALGWFPQIGITDDGFPMYSEKEFTIYERSVDEDHNIPTYTLQEVLDKLPKEILVKDIDFYTLNLDLGDRCLIGYDGECCNALQYYYIKDDNILEAAFNMLCWVLENGYL